MNSKENIALCNQKSYLAIHYCTKPHFLLNTHPLLCIRGNESLKVLVQLRRVIQRKTWSLNLNDPNKFGRCCNLSQRSNYLIQSLLFVNLPAKFIYILSSLKTQLRFKTHTYIHIQFENSTVISNPYIIQFIISGSVGQKMLML